MAVSELPGNPNAVWTVKKKSDGKLTDFNWLVSDISKIFHNTYFWHLIVLEENLK